MFVTISIKFDCLIKENTKKLSFWSSLQTLLHTTFKEAPKNSSYIKSKYK